MKPDYIHLTSGAGMFEVAEAFCSDVVRFFFSLTIIFYIYAALVIIASDVKMKETYNKKGYYYLGLGVISVLTALLYYFSDSLFLLQWYDDIAGSSAELHPERVVGFLLGLVLGMAIAYFSIRIRISEVINSHVKAGESLQYAYVGRDELPCILSICSYCHKIKDREGKWQQIEDYFSTRLEIEFSHGICTHCAARVTAERS